MYSKVLRNEIALACSGHRQVGQYDGKEWRNDSNEIGEIKRNENVKGFSYITKTCGLGES